LQTRFPLVSSQSVSADQRTPQGAEVADVERACSIPLLDTPAAVNARLMESSFLRCAVLRNSPLGYVFIRCVTIGILLAMHIIVLRLLGTEDGRTSSYIACFLTGRVAKLALIMTPGPTIGLSSYWQDRWKRAQKCVNLKRAVFERAIFDYS